MWTLEEAALSRCLIRIEPGEDLLQALALLAEERQWSDALVAGAGALELVELVKPSGVHETYADAELISLSGTIGLGSQSHTVSLRCTSMSGGKLHSGRIAAAVVGELLLRVDAVTVEAAAAAAVRRTPTIPPATLRARSSKPEVEPEPEAAPQRSVETEPRLAPSDAKPADIPLPDAPRGVGQPPHSAPKPPSRTFRTRPIPRRIGGVRPTLDDDEHLPEPGDFLDHPQLGLCRVEGTDAAGGTVITVPSGRRRTLKLEALRVLPAEEDDEGRRVLKIVGPRQRR